MKSIIKRVLMLLAVVILVAGGSGCMFMGMSSDEHKAEVLKYLEDKYGEKFEIYGVKNASWAYDFKTAYCRPVAHPEEEFEVRRSKEGISKYINFDGYALHLMNRQLRAYIEEITKGQWEDFKISTSVTTINHIIDVDYKQGMTLFEFVQADKWQNAFYNVGIYINAKDLDKNDATAMDEYFRGEPEKVYSIYKQYTDEGYYANFFMVYLQEKQYNSLDVYQDYVTIRDSIEEDENVVFWTKVGSSEEHAPRSLERVKELFDWRKEHE